RASAHAGVAQSCFGRCYAVPQQHLLVLRVVVFCVLADVSELARYPNPLCALPPLRCLEVVDLAFQLLVALGCEDDFLHLLAPLLTKKARRRGAVAGGNGSYAARRRQ